MPYPPALADRLAQALDLDGTGRLLDVGCGPGSLTLLLAPHFAEAVGIDADPDMLVEADHQARTVGTTEVVWRHLRAEELPADLARPTVVTFAQSFHWTDRPRVARIVRAMLADGGALVHVGARTHEGVPTDEPLPHPRPPRVAVATLIREHLGDVRRAGRSMPGGTPSDEDEVFRAAGFDGPERVQIPGRTLDRSAAEVRASVYSLSSAAPHLFGAGLDRFDAALRTLLAQASPDGWFSERLGPITLSIRR